MSKSLIGYDITDKGSRINILSMCPLIIYFSDNTENLRNLRKMPSIRFKEHRVLVRMIIRYFMYVIKSAS